MTKAFPAALILLSFAFRLVPCHAQTIETVAGGGFTAPTEPDTDRTSFSVGLVQAVAVESPSVLYVADATHGSVYRIADSISVIAGNGAPGNTPTLQNPTGLAVDGNGHLYIADQDAGKIFKVTTSSGTVQVVAGCGSINNPACPVQANYGDGGKATSAFIQPSSVSVDGSGNLFIADYLSCRVRKVDASDGTISTVAGSGIIVTSYGSSGCPSPSDLSMIGDGQPAVNAQLRYPMGLAVDSLGDIFIADAGTQRVRVVCAAGCSYGTEHYIYTVAGGGSGQIGAGTAGVAATSVTILQPAGLALDGQNLFITDFAQNVVVVVNTGSTPSTVGSANLASHDLQYVAGVVSQPYSAPVGPLDYTHLNGPVGLAFGFETLYIADSYNFAVRSLGLAANGFSPDLTTEAGNFAADTFVGGNAPLSSQLGNPAAVVEDASANLYISEQLYPLSGYSGQSSGRLLEALPATPALKQIAEPLFAPIGLFLDSTASLYFADGNLNKVSQAYGVVPVPFPVFSPPAYYADSSVDLFGDSADKMYYTAFVQDPGRVNLVASYSSSSFLVDGEISLQIGDYPYTGGQVQDGGPAQDAAFLNISGLCADSLGNIYITDVGTYSLRAINVGQQPLTIANQVIAPSSVETLAGGGGALPANYASHFDLSADQIGDGGPATSALLSPQACFVDNLGNIFIADGYNDRVRRVDFQSGNITTVAGSQYQGFSGDGGPAASATLNFPNSLWGDQAGNLLISDSGNHRIREIKNILPVPNATLACQNCALSNASGSNQSASVVVGNTGSAPLVMTSAPTLTDATDFRVSASTCPIGLPGLAASGTCQISVVATGSVDSSTQVILHDNAALSNGSRNDPDPNHAGQWAGYLQYSDDIGVTYLSAAVNLDPLSLVFTAVNVPQSIRVANTGSVPLVVSSVTVPAPYVLETNPPSDSCASVPLTVATNAFCNIYVAFMPQSPNRSGSNLAIVIADNTSTGTATIPVVGYALVPSGNTSLSVSNQSATPATATFNMVGIPPAALVTPLCSVTPAGLDVSCSYDLSSQTITATASIPSCTQTSQAGATGNRGMSGIISLGVVSIALLLPCFPVLRKRPFLLAIVVPLSCGIAGLSACSSANHVSSSCVASVAPGATFKLFVTANPQTAGDFPSLTLTDPDVVSVTQ